MITYTNYTNLDASFGRPYEPGDRLVKGWSGRVPPSHPSEALGCDMIGKFCASTPGHWNDGLHTGTVFTVAERIFAIHNRDDRPDGQLCPSMSIGDVIVIGEVALSVDLFGFMPVTLDRSDLIEDRTYLEVAR